VSLAPPIGLQPISFGHRGPASDAGCKPRVGSLDTSSIDLWIGLRPF
jgi:hypothetical protein